MADLVVTLSGNEAKLYQSMQRIIEQQKKLDEGFGRNKKNSKDAADSAVAGSKATEHSIGGIVSKIGALSGGFVTVSAAINEVQLGLQKIIDKQVDAHKAWKDIAAPQEDAMITMAGMAKEDLKKFLEERIPAIATEVGFPKLDVLAKAAAGAWGAVADPVIMESSVKQAARISGNNPEAVALYSQAFGDISKAIGSVDAREAGSMIMQVSDTARPSKPHELMEGAARVVSQGVAASRGADPKKGGAQAGAFWAALTSQGADIHGDTSAEAAGLVLTKMAEYFYGKEDDPILPFGRVEYLRKDPEKLEEFLEKMGGQDRYKLFVKEAIRDPDSPTMKLAQETFERLNFSPKFFEERAQMVKEGTRPLSMKSSENMVEANIQASRLANAGGAIRSSIAEIGMKALDETTHGLGMAFENRFLAVKRWKALTDEDNDIGKFVERQLTFREMQLYEHDQTPDIKAELQLLRVAKEEVEKLTGMLREITAAAAETARSANELAAAKREEVAATRTAAKQRNASSIREE